ncbi:MAG: ABC transporter permease [Candidatus Thiodiazotropha sp.]
MPIFSLTIKSLWNRRYTAFLTLLSIALSVTLLLGVERVRTEARSSFANTLSGTDLVVGARSGPIQLLLYSVFRIGNATNNISWQSYREIADRPEVAWSVPLSLGDSHKGFRVLGTNQDYFKHYRYGNKQPLAFAEGAVFTDLYDAVIGAEVARKLHYRLGQEIVLAHGAGAVSFVQHADKPFHIVGILKRTGTPIDQTVHVSLQAIEAIHVDYRDGAPLPGHHISAEQARSMDLEPKAITAFLVGLHSKVATFRLQRWINEYPEEPLLAILPGVALQELWDMIGVGERALLAVSTMVLLVGLTGMLTVLLASLNERRRELAILRSVGARPWQLFLLMVSEASCLTALGAVFGIGLLYLVLLIARPFIESQFGLQLGVGMLTPHELNLLVLLMGGGLLIGAIPAWRAYRYSLADGMSIRV